MPSTHPHHKKKKNKNKKTAAQKQITKGELPILAYLNLLIRGIIIIQALIGWQVKNDQNLSYN